MQPAGPHHKHRNISALDQLPQNLIQRAQWLSALDHLLRQSLPPTLRDQCQLANVRGSRLVFLVRSPAVGPKLRLLSANLLSTAQQLGLTVDQLTVKVATMEPVPQDSTSRTPLSPAARENLRAAALTVSDPELRDQLLRMASMADSFFP
ncbi:DciA family protein [Pseudomarimonas arenosa]|uniref:DUF721 domain-containing protein n=1 Tax=Pseudomarimonas arenosa TaxID=2774145 RepID=A0AAW3ZHH4_9GAMM|nr:DciA family protein [Pseudomarimonas arenosa]MBD8525463.1 DUF721 domain-containing protein [Pseudomarimonas arenosa]